MNALVPPLGEISEGAGTSMQAAVPTILLAPMEGVIDAPMRAFLTSMGGYDRCVTEFIRVTDVRLPEKVFLRLCPELAEGAHTPSGTPVYTQLLGNHREALAANALRAVALGAPGIDLNFGCPAKTVNNSQGGSILLRYPGNVAALVAAVRDSVPAEIPVTAKIRLGYDNTDQLERIVTGISEAGATEIAIHARTKFDGYKPPAFWSRVGELERTLKPRIYINGEIWSVSDSRDARVASRCQHVMLGRGALAAPDLANRIKQGSNEAPMAWEFVLDRVERQFALSDSQSPRHVGNRTKQWLAYLKRNYPQANDLFKRLRTLHDTRSIHQAFNDHRRLDLQAA